MSSWRSLFSIKRAFDKDERRIDTFEIQHIRKRTPLRPGSVWSSSGMDILQEKKEKSCFFYLVLGKSRQSLEFARSLWFFFCRNVDGCRHRRIGSGKETESIMRKLGGEWRKRQSECGESVCRKGNAETTLHEKSPPPRKNSLYFCISQRRQRPPQSAP